MALSAGTKLGPYEILSQLGSGGMGEVYRARDTRLDRVAAVKILPSHLSESAEAKQRFEREARTISSLNHPYICTLYDVGQQDGVDYLVMEYLEGETLADRLRKCPLPIEQVFRYDESPRIKHLSEIPNHGPMSRLKNRQTKPAVQEQSFRTVRFPWHLNAIHCIVVFAFRTAISKTRN
jgi:serine/threonine protein kinase